MSPITLTHIVPALWPQIDGVGDYALNLAVQLRETQGIESKFIVCDPERDGPSRVEDFVVRRLRLRNEAGIWSMLAAAKGSRPAVILHYACTGYQKHGVPFWLYRGIRSWLDENSGGIDGLNKQLCTVFHEPWLTSPKPWENGFCLRMLRRHLVEGLHRWSNISVASTRRLKTLLEDIEPHKTAWMPMPSNVPVNERARANGRPDQGLRVAIFGQPRSRHATIRAHANLLRTLDQKNILASVMVFGRGLNPGGSVAEDLNLLRKSVRRERTEVLGELSPQGVSGTLDRADLFLSHHPGELACKSGAFMAALGAGCPAVLRDGRNASPLYESEHFVASDDSRSSVARLERMRSEGKLERIAETGRQWYERFANWKVIAQTYRQTLFEGGVAFGTKVVGMETAQVSLPSPTMQN